MSSLGRGGRTPPQIPQGQPASSKALQSLQTPAKLAGYANLSELFGAPPHLAAQFSSLGGWLLSIRAIDGATVYRALDIFQHATAVDPLRLQQVLLLDEHNQHEQAIQARRAAFVAAQQAAWAGPAVSSARPPAPPVAPPQWGTPPVTPPVAAAPAAPPVAPPVAPIPVAVAPAAPVAAPTTVAAPTPEKPGLAEFMEASRRLEEVRYSTDRATYLLCREELDARQEQVVEAFQALNAARRALTTAVAGVAELTTEAGWSALIAGLNAPAAEAEVQSA